MHQIFHAYDAEFAKVLLDDLVIREWNPLLVDLSISTLVDKIADRLHGGVTIGDVGFDDFEHFGCRFGNFDKDTVVDLKETE